MTSSSGTRSPTGYSDMRPIGFSTGALALGDFRSALAMLVPHSVKAVELSALRDKELMPLMAALPSLDLEFGDVVPLVPATTGLSTIATVSIGSY